jgi:glycolate oxidase
MSAENFASTLAGLLGANKVLTAREDLIPYSFDGTATLKQLPVAVVFAECTEDVAKTVRACGEAGVAVVARGSGTGLSGGSVPTPGCVVLSLQRMNRILETDTRNLCMLVEAGVRTIEIDAEAARNGLFYPPDPSSMKISTIGGNVANNSGGLRGLKYGVTRDYVMGLEVVLADGETVWLGSKCVKDVAGYSLRDLFIGSEGTLGIITRILLKLTPRPAARRTLLATYPSMEQAAATVSAIIAKPIIPCTMEFLDRTTIQCVEEYAKIGLPLNCEALLFLETDGAAAVVEEEAAAMEKICRDNGALEVTIAKDDAHATRLATARRSAFSALARIRPTTILEDITVPRSELARTVRFVEETAKKHNVRIATFGHFGDGNLHPTFLTDERDKEEMHRVEAAMHEIFAFATEIGGTITGEHGVGLAKKEFLPAQFGDASMQLLRLIKKALDPKNILNPAKIFDL